MADRIDPAIPAIRARLRAPAMIVDLAGIFDRSRAGRIAALAGVSGVRVYDFHGISIAGFWVAWV